MLYLITKFINQIGFRFNFRKVFMHYHSDLPNDKSIVFVVNHPTAFLDPVMLGAYLKRPTHFIVRGDIFKGKIVLAFLRGLKLIPIFRFRDGYANMKNNQVIMEGVYQILADKKCLMVLAEGQTKHEKRLRPIQKGTARMIFGTVEKHGDIDLCIVPVGINYTDSDKFRSYTMLEVGKPIDLKEFMPAYRENPRKGVKQMTDRIQTELRNFVIHIEDEKDDKWVNRVLEISRNDYRYKLLPVKQDDGTFWEREYKTVEFLNTQNESQKAEIQQHLEEYDNLLKKNTTIDRGVARPDSFNLSNTLLLLIGFAPFLIGYIFGYPTMRLAKNFAKRKVKQIEFHASVRYGVALVSSWLLWLIFLIVALVVWHPFVIGFVILLPFLGYFALIYKEIFEKWNAARRFRSLSKKDQGHLIKSRKAVLDYIKI